MASSLTQHIKKVVDASGKKSLLSFIFSMEGLKMFGDGNIGWVGVWALPWPLPAATRTA